MVFVSFFFLFFFYSSPSRQFVRLRRECIFSLRPSSIGKKVLQAAECACICVCVYYVRACVCVCDVCTRRAIFVFNLFLLFFAHCSLRNRSHRSMFPFPLYRHIPTFRLFSYALLCVDDAAGETRRRWSFAKPSETNVEREPGEKWIDAFSFLSFFLSFFSYLLAFLSHRIRASIDISRHFLFQGGPEKTVGTKLAGTRFERQSDSCAQSKGGRGWRQHRSRPPDCDKTRIEFYSQPRNSIRDEVVVSARNEPNP